MISPFRMNLKAEWLPALADLSGVNPGVLSAWRAVDPIPLPEEARTALADEGALDPSGAPTPAFKAVLDLLASPAAAASLEFSSSLKTFDYRVFFSSLEGDSILLISNGEELVFTAPLNPADVLADLRRFTGESPLQSATLTADLPPAEALALTTLLDKRRRARLISIATGTGLESTALTPAQAAEQAAAETDASQWLTAALGKLAGLETPPDASHMAAGLLNLVNRGLVDLYAGGESYLPIAEAARLADNLLIIDHQVKLVARRCNADGDVNQVEFLALQSGVQDILLVELHAGLVKLEAISAANLLEKVDLYLSKPDALPLPALRSVAWRLELTAPGGIQQEYELTSETKIGRGSDCEIQILDPRSSRHHALIRQVDGGYILSDLGSTNGTYINHVLIKNPVRLQEGDLIRIGETYLRLVASRVMGDTTPTALRQPPAAPVPETSPEPADQPASAEQPGYEPPAWLTASDEPSAMEIPVEDVQSAPESSAEESAPEGDEPLAWLRAAADEPAPEVAAEPAAETEAPPEAETPDEISPASEEVVEQPEEPILGATHAAASVRVPTEQVCPRCGNASPMEARFCGACGNPLHE